MKFELTLIVNSLTVQSFHHNLKLLTYINP